MTNLTYKDAGVDIDAGDALVERIKPYVKQTERREVLGDIGGFGALFEIPLDRFQQPVLVSGTDGVGTKLKLAMELQHHDTIGIDLVAMCVNDVLAHGAEPLFFLDYYATGQLSVEMALKVIQGIAVGCKQAGCSLVGGETAEMPGMYHGEDYDLAGFCVGIVEKSKIIQPKLVKPGDVLLGLASSGLHSNGFSLVRKILSDSNSKPDKSLLTPTKIYVKSILQLLKEIPVHGIAHITGGGLPENLPRVLPDYTCASIHINSWKRPEIFNWLQRQGNIADSEMLRTFNCGIGMVICVEAKDLDKAKHCLERTGETVFNIGKIEKALNPEPSVKIV